MKSYPPGHEILYYAPAVNLAGSRLVCNFVWHFDDGEVKQGAVVTKSWDSEGIHTATCKATNIENGQSGEGKIDVCIKVDNPNASSLSFSLSRASSSFNLYGDLLANNQPILEKVYWSDAAFSTLPNLDTNIDASTTVWNYTNTVQKMKDLANAYPGYIVYEDISRISEAELLVSGREQSALKILDDGTKPIIIFHTVTHGNERHSVMGIYRAIELILTSSDPLYVWARQNLCFYWIVLVNPDGAYWDKRGPGDWPDQANDLNTNRMWPYYWDYAIDPDKGSVPLAVPEVRNLKKWIEPKVSRALLCVDFHMWFSQTIYGYLVDHIWRSVTSQAFASAIYNYSNNLMQQRDYTGIPIVSSSGKSNMTLSYRKKSRKPYFEEWVAQRMDPRGFAFQIELPQAESQALNAAASLDIVTAMLQASHDVLNGEKEAYHLAPAVSPENILNKNSWMNAWSSTDPRPQYMSVSSFEVQQDTTLGTTEGLVKVKTWRPKTAAWPEEFSNASCCFIDTGNDRTSYFIVAGGVRSTGYSDKAHIEYLQPPEPPQPGSSISSVYVPQILQKKAIPLPYPLVGFALATDNTWIYLVCGYGLNSTYYNKIYRIRCDAVLTGAWELFHTLTTYSGLQRHTAHIYNNDLYIIGGRDSAGYNKNIVKINLSTKSESIYSVLTEHTTGAGFGWHSSLLIGNILYIIGGWGGATARTNVTSVNLDTGVKTVLAPLLYARRQAQVGYNPEDQTIWLFAGRGDSSYSEAAYKYTISENVWNGYLADSGYIIEMPEPDGDEDGQVLSRPTFFCAAGSCVYNRFTKTFLIIGGENENAVIQSRVWEFDTANMSASLRAAQDMLWGYIGPSTMTSAAPGKQLSFVNLLRNAQDENDLDVQPIARPVIYVNPYGASPRKARHAFVVPPKTYLAISQHLDIETRNYSVPQQVRTRLRHYGGGTSLELKCIQLTDVPYLAVPVPSTGKAQDILTVDINPPIFSQKTRNIAFGLLPRWGSQLKADLKIIDFITTQDSDISNMYLKWISEPTISPTNWSPSENHTGYFKLFYTINGVENSINICQNGEIAVNHDRFVTFHRRDFIHFKITGKSNGFSVILWFYGKSFTINVDCESTIISKLICYGTGCSVCASKPIWFS